MARNERTVAFSICAVGFKGAEYLAALVAGGAAPTTVFSYRQPDDRSNGFDTITALCRSHDIPLIESKRPDCSGSDPIFFVGWQYLMRDIGQNAVVFHDSLLPRYRGFAPTVNALIRGEPRIGVTAFRPDGGIDSGPVVGQRDAALDYPVRVEKALRIQAGLMAALTSDLLKSHAAGAMAGQMQNDRDATYSIWRDDEDYRIDWTASAAEIQRLVDAVSFPYAGAITRLGEQALIVDAATACDDLAFELRHPGKVFSLEDGKPMVVCGRGMLRLDVVMTLDRAPYVFDRLRVRFA